METSPISDDLRIVKNIQFRKLPKKLQTILKDYPTDAKKDIALMVVLTVLSSALPNVFFWNGSPRSEKYPNIMFIVDAVSAAGKSIINYGRSLIKLVDRLGSGIIKEDRYLDSNHRLIIDGDISAPKLVSQLEIQEGSGILISTEANTINRMCRNNAGTDYRTYLCLAGEHESIEYSRKESHSYVENPKLSMLISGTPDQIPL